MDRLCRTNISAENVVVVTEPTTARYKRGHHAVNNANELFDFRERLRISRWNLNGTYLLANRVGLPLMSLINSYSRSRKIAR